MCLVWAVFGDFLLQTHFTVCMNQLGWLILQAIGSCDLKCLNNKREDIESLNWEGQRWEGFRHSSIRTPPLILLSFSSVLFVGFIFSFIHGSKLATVKWLIYTNYNFQSNRVSMFQVPDLYVELHGDWITSEGIHSFLRQSYSNEDSTWSNHCDRWR